MALQKKEKQESEKKRNEWRHIIHIVQILEIPLPSYIHSNKNKLFYELIK